MFLILIIFYIREIRMFGTMVHKHTGGSKKKETPRDHNFFWEKAVDSFFLGYIVILLWLVID